MPRTSATTRTKIVDEAYRHAREGGLAALSVRSVARDCGVSVGTLYNYFPDKAALTAAVIERFWKEVVFADGAASCLAYHEGERFVDFCRRVERTFSAALADFRTNWLGEMGGLDARSRQRGRATERAYFDHICTNLEKVARADAAIDGEALEKIGAAKLARFTWTSMLDHLRRNEPCDTLFALLERALYRAG